MQNIKLLLMITTEDIITLLSVFNNGERISLARVAVQQQLASLSPSVPASPWLVKMTVLMAGRTTLLYVLFLQAVSHGIPAQHQL